MVKANTILQLLFTSAILPEFFTSRNSRLHSIKHSKINKIPDNSEPQQVLSEKLINHVSTNICGIIDEAGNWKKFSLVNHIKLQSIEISRDGSIQGVQLETFKKQKTLRPSNVWINQPGKNWFKIKEKAMKTATISPTEVFILYGNSSKNLKLSIRNTLSENNETVLTKYWEKYSFTDFAINRYGQLYLCRKMKNPKENHIVYLDIIEDYLNGKEGGFSKLVGLGKNCLNISIANDDRIWMVDNSGQVWSKGKLSENFAKVNTPELMSSVVIDMGGRIWGLSREKSNNGNHKIWTLKSYQDYMENSESQENWNFIQGNFVQLAVGGPYKQIWAINHLGNVYHSDCHSIQKNEKFMNSDSINKLRGWHILDKIKENKKISIGNSGEIYKIDKDYNLQVKNGLYSSKWELINPENAFVKLKQIATAKNGYLYGIDQKDVVWANPEARKWGSMDYQGRFHFTHQTITADDRILAVDKQGLIWVKNGTSGIWNQYTHCSGAMTCTGEKISRIAVDFRGRLWGIDNYSNVVSMTDGNNWEDMRLKNATDICVDKKGRVFVISKGNVYESPEYQSGWIEIDRSGLFEKIAANDDGKQWAIDKSGQILWRNIEEELSSDSRI